jgi:hypothetical protein
MSPELPYLAAGGVAIVGATYRDGKLPDLMRPVVGIVACVLVASAFGETKLGPLVQAFGMLVLLVTVMAATNSVLAKRKA